jgi:hypothetical protein
MFDKIHAKKIKLNLFLSATKPPAPISAFFVTYVYQNSKMFDKHTPKILTQTSSNQPKNHLRP